MGNDPEAEKLEAMAARIRQAGEKPKVDDLAGTVEPMKASRIGFDFMAAVLVCTFLGWLGDKTLGTKPWGLLIMIGMGFAVGITNVWRALGNQKPD